MRFTSKKDFWLGAFIWLSAVIPLIMFIRDQLWYGLLIMIPVFLFLVWVWFGTYYDITEKEVKIRCGPIKETVPFDKIIKIRKTRNLVSSAALSLNRLEIQYGKYNFTYISPKNKEEFINTIKEKCPTVEVD